MANKKLLWILNLLVLVVILLQAYGLTKGATVTATGGSASSNVLISGNSAEALTKARQRGYFTAKDYAEFKGIDRETVYRRLDAGEIPNAEKVNHRWRIQLH